MLFIMAVLMVELPAEYCCYLYMLMLCYMFVFTCIYMYLHVCMLQLVDGRVQYTFECGSGPASMITGENMNDGNWHNVTLERNGKS